MVNLESKSKEPARIEFRSMEDVLAKVADLRKRIAECDENGSHIGEQIFLGPARGRYDPLSNVQCSHCSRSYIARDPDDGSKNDLADKFLRAAYLML